MEKRSPWGGKHVDAIIKDCAEKRALGARAAAEYIAGLERRQINSADQFFAGLALVEAPFAYEKLTALMLRCEGLPSQPHHMGPDPCQVLCDERGVNFLRQFSALEQWPSTEHLLTHLVALWTNRVRDKTAGGYQRAKKGILGPAQGIGGRRLDGSNYASS
jgi:hypothetical protein